MFREKTQSQDFKISSHHQIQLGPLENAVNLEPTPIKEEELMDTASNRISAEKREVNFLRLIHPSLDHREILIQPFSKKQGKRKGYR